MRRDGPRAISLTIVRATPRTQWIFVEVETESGLRGVGEATLPGREDAVVQAVDALAPAVLAMADGDPTGLRPDTPGDLAEAAARSAFDQALWDIAAQRRGISLAEMLGEVRRDRVRVYANINRRTSDRSSAGFAESARAAVAAGHDAIKLAPFDEASGQGDDIADLAPGFARLAAVRDVIGPTRALMIDCHWRLSPATAEHVIAAAADIGAYWIECPLPETADNLPALTRLRAAANRRDILLAGMENAIGVEGFAPLIRAGAYDVMMPDIKYVGGLRDVIVLSEQFARAGIGFSPHNPSGPICHTISLQLCAVVGEIHSLETQFDETPLFQTVVTGGPDKVSAGTMSIGSVRGAGRALRADQLVQHRTMRWTGQRARA